MAKKIVQTSKVMIACPYYRGELALMPQEAKDAMKAEKPEVHKMLFEKEETPIENA